MINHLVIVVGMGCEIKCIGTTESTKVPYVSVQLICAIATTSYHQKMFLKNNNFEKSFSAQ